MGLGCFGHTDPHQRGTLIRMLPWSRKPLVPHAYASPLALQSRTGFPSHVKAVSRVLELLA